MYLIVKKINNFTRIKGPNYFKIVVYNFNNIINQQRIFI